MPADTPRTVCPACRRDDDVRVFFESDPTVFRCRCGFVFHTETIEYEARDKMTWAATRDFREPDRRAGFVDMARRLACLSPGAEILDIGCGDGHFLSVASSMGFIGAGIEGNSELAAHAHRVTGASVASGLYGQSMFPPASFDAVTFIQVLEHIPDPRSALEAAHHHLRPEGVVLIEVPSLTAPHFLAYRITRIRAFIRPPRGINISHCNYFSPTTLRRLVESQGFTTEALVCGRWSPRYDGWKRAIGRCLDPVADALRIGGILLIARRSPEE